MRNLTQTLLVVIALLFSPAVGKAYDLQLTSALSNQLTLSGSASTGYTIVTTGGDPYVFTTQFASDIPGNVIQLTYEYRSDTDINDLQLFFADPTTEPRSVHKYGLMPRCSEWKRVTIDLSAQRQQFDWGHKNDRLRFDFGTQAGVTLQVRSLEMIGVGAATWTDKLVFANGLVDYLNGNYLCSITHVSVTADQVVVRGQLSGSADCALAEVPVNGNVTTLEKAVVVKQLSGSTFEVAVPRMVTTGNIRDRLLSRWIVVDAGCTKLLSKARYVDEVTPLRSAQKMILKSKKGLGGYITNSYSYDLDSLRVGSVTVNVVLNELIGLRSTGGFTTPYEYGGRTYYINSSRVAYYDGVFKAATSRGILTLAILLATPGGGESGFAQTICHPEYTTGPYTMPNVATEDGARLYAAIINYLADRYSQEANGRINYWIMHNEVDNGSYWTNMGAQPMLRYLDTYEKSMRLVYNIARQYDQNAYVLGSFTHFWNYATSGNYPTKEMLEKMVDYSHAEGDYQWGVALHPYPQNLRAPAYWVNDKQATYDLNTSYITFQNPEVISAWMLQLKNLYKGAVKRPLFFSENGTNSPSYDEDDLKLQAAGAALIWKKVKQLKGVDAIQWHNWRDNPVEDGLRIGLRDYDGNPKPAYYVWKAADTENESSVLDRYLGTLGLENWNGIIHNVMSTGVSTLKTGSRSLEVCSVQGGIKVRASGAGQLCTIYEITGTAVVSQKVKGCRFITLPRGVYIVNGRKVAVR